METNNQTPETNGDFTKKPVQGPEMQTANFQPNNRPLLTRQSVSGIAGFYQANKWYVWAIALGVVMIGVLAYLAFRKSPAQPPKEANVQVSISAPETVASGAEVLYAVKVENNDAQKITQVNLELVYPEGVTYLQATPQKAANLSGTQFTIPDLSSGNNAVVFVKTKVTGGINDTKTLGVKLHYQLANFNSDFTKEASFAVRLTASDVAFDLTGPVTVNNSQLITYTLKYKNNSKNDIKNGQITITYPAGFEFAAATPEASQSNNVWTIATLPMGGEGTIAVQGSYRNSQPGESKTIQAQYQVLGSNGQQFSQAETKFVTAISTLPLVLTQEFGNSNDSNPVANPGDILQFKLAYQNNGSTGVTGVNIIATLDSKVLDLSTLQAEGAQVNNNSIIWNASSVKQLESLNPSDKGQVSFTVRVKDPATKDNSKDLTVVSSVKIKSNEYEYFPGNSITVKIASPSSLAGSVEYVSGQLPPQVGKPTTYKVKLSIKNSSNDYSNGILTAFIPLGAGGFDSGSIAGTENGKATYDSSTGKLTWNVGQVPAFSGTFRPAKTLEFKVTLNPSSSQAGNSPTLVKTITFAAKDIFTTQDINLKADDLTTDDVSGSGYGQGTVIQ